jgi:hypothetical protein
MWINKSTLNDDEWEAGLKVEPDTQYARLVQRYIALKDQSHTEEEYEQRPFS